MLIAVTVPHNSGNRCNYDGQNPNGLQNSAFALGTAGTLNLAGLGDPAGFSLNTIEDTARGTDQVNSFAAGGGYSIQLGTASGDLLGTSPAP